MGPHFCFYEGWRNLLMGLNSVERRDLMTQERAGIFGAMSLGGMRWDLITAQFGSLS